MAKCQTEVSADGFETIRLFNSCMSVSVFPQLGGKILNIVNLETGRDWLWKNPHIALRQPQPDMDYGMELDSGGWDEILFSVNPSTLTLPSIGKFSIGDHGTLVDKAWKQADTHVDASGEAVCELFAEGQSPHFRLARKIILDARRPQMYMEYTLTNTGESNWPWFWSAHPLLAIETGMQIKLAHGLQTLLVENELTNQDSNETWPMITSSNGEEIDLENIFETASPEEYCQKLFVSSTGQARLCTADGRESFCMTYDPESLPWLGLWINKNGWSGCGSPPYVNLGIEPTTTPHDKLSDSVASNQIRLLKPGESVTWSLSIDLENKAHP